VDENDAFQAMKITTSAALCTKLVFKVRRKLKILVPKKALQGHRLSPLFYPMWKMLILTRVIGWAAALWYSIYMDDNLAKAPIEQRAHGRARILAMIFKVFSISVSPKCLPFEAILELVCAGQFMTAEGYCCSAELEEVIGSLAKVKVSDIRQMQHVVDVAAHCSRLHACQPHVLRRFDRAHDGQHQGGQVVGASQGGTG
jgi:hypothetical protein